MTNLTMTTTNHRLKHPDSTPAAAIRTSNGFDAPCRGEVRELEKSLRENPKKLLSISFMDCGAVRLAVAGGIAMIISASSPASVEMLKRKTVEAIEAHSSGRAKRAANTIVSARHAAEQAGSPGTVITEIFRLQDDVN